MTASDKADQLKQAVKKTVIKYMNIPKLFHDTADKATQKIALQVVEEIEKALTEYGETTFELQNMDYEFRFWEKVRNEIKKT